MTSIGSETDELEPMARLAKCPHGDSVAVRCRRETTRRSITRRASPKAKSRRSWSGRRSLQHLHI